MRIFKFGGASVKDASGVRNVCRVLQTVGYDDTGIVVSAMGKTTNALEEIIKKYLAQDHRYIDLIDKLESEHVSIIEELENTCDGEDVDRVARFRESGIKKEISTIFKSLTEELLRNKSKSYSFLYDQVVSHGELMSTKIVAAYLNSCGIGLQWKDARELIKTDQKYRDAAVDWEKSERLVQQHCSDGLFITQGFIASDVNGFTTTLGREGSDYTAAILAYCLKAQSVTIWKDVPGVLNADPRVFENTVLLNQIPYNEAIELAFYGASVIHPKTLQPLQGKKIPLYVKSFISPEDPGTVITDTATIEPYIPCYIVRKDMVFLKISSRDFSFIGENNISDIFQELSEHKMQVGLLQNSAISFSICIEDKYAKLNELLNDLKTRYQISHVTGVSLYTVRHYDETALEFIEEGKEVLLKQRAQETLQLIVME